MSRGTWKLDGTWVDRGTVPPDLHELQHVRGFAKLNQQKKRWFCSMPVLIFNAQHTADAAATSAAQAKLLLKPSEGWGGEGI